MRKLLFYSHDSYGLGNIRRMVAIANYLVSRHQDLYILLITGSPMLHAFRTHPQIDYIKLPCLQRDQSGVYSAKLSCLNTQNVVNMRADIIQRVVASFAPDLILIDKKPEGLSGELKQTLFLANSLSPTPKCVLLLRDILDTPENTQRIWKKNHYYQLIEHYYDQVLVVGEQRIFDVTEQYNFPDALIKKTTFCGYLHRTETESQHDALLEKLNGSGKKLIVVAAGGGNDGKLVLETYLHACLNSNWQNRANSMVFYGPEMSQEDVEQLQELAKHIPNVTLSEFSANFIAYLKHADLVIAMAGYNTVCEILSVERPAIIVPRVSPVAEQLIRAQHFAKLEIFEFIHPKHLTPNILNNKITNKLFSEAAKLPFYQHLDLFGMERLERHLLTF